ncbi:DUF4249 family protein [Aureibacter tunicatorum]|uniref:DUF4249 family protein n=1 Tax=Aureibacter tunicatorum TaxID=866807 RepID=A0AAE3XQU4_9BACT|nr:DUF4249 family protein [Aureibacter tunicatorum]MDR6240344.1 hypothetical protein [Aureibacter tunicatorum]BDD05775.1 hypothetical protein AUTU_32580 [Aureibacter tunicatorum]
MKFQTWLLFLIITSLFTACLPKQDEASIDYVVEAYLRANGPIENILLYKVTGNDRQTVVSNAQVLLTIDDQTLRLKYSTDKGYYFPDSTVLVEHSKSYHLKMLVDERVIESTTIVPEVIIAPFRMPKVISIPDDSTATGLLNRRLATFKWSNIDKEYYLGNLKYMENKPDPLPYKGSRLASLAERLSVVNLPTTADTIPLIGADFTDYGRYQFILYKINDEYVEVFDGNSLVSLSTTSNIENALGIFTATSSDTFFLNVVRKNVVLR